MLIAGQRTFVRVEDGNGQLVAYVASDDNGPALGLSRAERITACLNEAESTEVWFTRRLESALSALCESGKLKPLTREQLRAILEDYFKP